MALTNEKQGNSISLNERETLNRILVVSKLLKRSLANISNDEYFYGKETDPLDRRKLKHRPIEDVQRSMQNCLELNNIIIETAGARNTYVENALVAKEKISLDK